MSWSIVFNFANFLKLFSVVTIGSLLYFLYRHLKNYNESDNVSKMMLHMMSSSLLVTVFSFSGLNAPNAIASQVLYSLSLLFFDLVVFHFFCFVEVYTKKQYSIPQITLCGVALGLNAVAAVCNMVLHQYFVVKELTIDDKIYYTFETMPMYFVNWCLLAGFAGLSLVKLIIMALNVPKVYRKKYTSIFLSVMVVFVCSVIYVVFDIGLEIAYFVLPYVALVCYYCAFISSPVDFMRRVRAAVIEHMDSGVILFDYNNNVVDYNPTAKQILQTDDKKMEQTVAQWLEANKIDINKDDVCDFKDAYLKGEPILRVSSILYWDDPESHLPTGIYLIIADRTLEVKQQEKQLFIARHDSLTQLLNRNAFFEEVQKTLQDGSEAEYYFVCTDIENFKLYNGLFGSSEGDRFLINLAETLRRSFGDRAIMGRLGSDRYGILMKKEDFSEYEFAQDFKIALNMSTRSNYSINAYLGIYEIDDRTISVSEMCERAIMAVQSVKGQPDKFVGFYDSTLINAVVEEQELIDDIRRALSNHEFTFYIQPQLTAGDNKVLGGEALVRWQHPQKGIVSPFYFIGVMETHGMIANLDYEVWEKACEKLSQWKSIGRTDMYISVNISPKDFYYRDIYTTFVNLVEKYDISPDKLKLEITESAVMQNQEEQMKLIDRLREYGFTVEMDDFGSGYSSLNMLNKLNVDVLKIDMGFLQKDADASRSKEILKLIQGLAKSLGMKTIVEGVETREQADFLTGIGCDMFQGYLFSQPIPVKEFEEKYMGL